MVDRRLIGWGEREGVDATIESLSGTIALAEDLHLETARIAAGAGAGVVRQLWRGRFVEAAGRSRSRSDSGSSERRVAGVEIFEGSETEAHSSFEEIGARRSPSARCRRSRMVNARDWDGSALLRRGLRSGRSARARWSRSAALRRSWRLPLVGRRSLPDLELRFEVLAGDDGHVAIRAGGDGHRPPSGRRPTEYVVTLVRRFATAGSRGASCSTSTTRPRRWRASRSCAEAPRELVRDYVDALNSRDWDRPAGVFAPELAGRPAPRRLGGDRRARRVHRVPERHARAGPDLHVDAELIAPRAARGRRPLINRGHLAEGGGEFEIACSTWRSRRTGKSRTMSCSRARHRGRARALRGDRRADRARARVRASAAPCNARDWDGLVDCYTDGPRDGGPPRARLGAAAAEARGDRRDVPLLGELVPDLEVRFEALAGDDEHLAVRYGGHGHAAEGGGAMEYVTTMAEGFATGANADEMFEPTARPPRWPASRSCAASKPAPDRPATRASSSTSTRPP